VTRVLVLAFTGHSRPPMPTASLRQHLTTNERSGHRMPSHPHPVSAQHDTYIPKYGAVCCRAYRAVNFDHTASSAPWWLSRAIIEALQTQNVAELSRCLMSN
jgi:hypothetical protein